jgi:hypothetical protein
LSIAFETGYNASMNGTEEDRAGLAASASEDALTLYLHDPSPKVVRAVLENRSLTEEHVLIIANRKNLPSEILESIFRDKRWTDSYPVRLALARNPKTPSFVALSISRFLRLFDLADLARNHFLPVLYRKKVEAIVIEKIPTLALGVKKTLAKIAAGDILLALLQDGYPEVVRQCLENPHLVEAHLYKAINRKITSPGTIRTITENKNWTCRYHIKFALVRNEHTPLARSVLFLPDLRTADLRELYRDPHLPSGVRPSVHRELMERGEDPGAIMGGDDESVYEIGESEMDDLDRELDTYEANGEELRQDRPDHGVADENPDRESGV